MSNKTSEIGLLAPQRAPLTPAQEREALALLAELLLEGAAKRRGLRSAGALDGVSDGGIWQRREVLGGAREGA